MSSEWLTTAQAGNELSVTAQTIRQRIAKLGAAESTLFRSVGNVGERGNPTRYEVSPELVEMWRSEASEGPDWSNERLERNEMTIEFLERKIRSQIETEVVDLRERLAQAEATIVEVRAEAERYREMVLLAVSREQKPPTS